MAVFRCVGCNQEVSGDVDLMTVLPEGGEWGEPTMPRGRYSIAPPSFQRQRRLGHQIRPLRRNRHGISERRAQARSLRAVVDLGGDTDTVAAVTGGLAGAVHGLTAVPGRWTERVHTPLPGFGPRIRRAADLVDLARKLATP
jgi:hypothetical protein